MKLYQDELCSFMERLKKRGKDKRDDALREYEAEEKEKRVKESPGGNQYNKIACRYFIIKVPILIYFFIFRTRSSRSV